jgi:hypothetical protein
MEKAKIAMDGDVAALPDADLIGFARTIGLALDADRLPAVRTVLSELLELAARLETLDLDGVEPGDGDPTAAWEAPA